MTPVGIERSEEHSRLRRTKQFEFSQNSALMAKPRGTAAMSKIDAHLTIENDDGTRAWQSARIPYTIGQSISRQSPESLMRSSQLVQRMTALLMLGIATMPAKAGTEDDHQLARRHLRCAAFYLAGSNEVTKPELKQQLRNLTNISLYSAEVLMDKDRPRVKEEFATARKNLLAETRSDEVKADTRGFMQYMGEHCAELRKNHPVPLPQKSS